MLSKFGAGRGARLLTAAGAAALVVTGLGLMASPAGATPKTFTGVACNAHVQEINLDTSTTQDFTVEATSPTEANAGTDVLITIPASDTTLPSSATASGATFTINNFTNLSNQYVVHGANVVAGSITVTGVPKNNGSTVTGDVAFDGNSLVISTPGPLDPGTLSTPKITFKVHAGAAGTTITVTPGDIKLTTFLNGALHAAVTCDLSGVSNNTLTTTQVVSPPPPGAPDAVADVASTKHDVPVTVDVLKNDKPNPDIAFDPASVEVTSNPGHGTATVNADHTITYTPAAGFHGTDSFDYKLCSMAQEINPPAAAKTAATDGPACDTATVTIDVAAPVVATTTTTTVATQGSTAAPATTVAAAAELPRTGSSSTPLALIGAGLLGLGLVAVRGTRRRHV